LRSYPAMLSTEADALAWGRSGAPHGAVVVADYQASPRGRAGLEWRVTQGRGLGFSLVVRPALPAEREGWLYTAATSGLADLAGPAAMIAWPDEVRHDGRPAATVGINAQLGPLGVEWAVVTVLIVEADPPRGPLLRRALAAIEERCEQIPDAVLFDYRPRCETLGRTVRARLIPVGPGGAEVSGRASGTLPDGALVLVRGDGRRIAVRPQHLGLLEDA
jgi:BirA family biotin operon repressor/biotin-[acetyl-CoA-carboxylase] ligase